MSTEFQFDHEIEVDKTLADWPVFDCDYSYDERYHPSEVTIFPKTNAGLMTQWITADLEDTVPLTEVQ